MKINAFFFLKLNTFTLNININLQNIKILTIFGESGSGKTTLLKCISGLISPNKSYFKINDVILQDSKNKVFIKTNKRKIGYIQQNPTLFSHLSVYENIFLGKEKKNTYIKSDTIINLFKLNKILKRNVNNLSGGEKQRVLISQVLLTQPEIIILDEPLSAQDENMKKFIIKYIKNLNENFNIPIIWVSHNINELKMLSKDIIYINKGKIIYKKI